MIAAPVLPALIPGARRGTPNRTKPSTTPNRVLPGAARVFEAMAAAQSAYVESMVELHGRYLRLQQQATQVLLTAPREEADGRPQARLPGPKLGRQDLLAITRRERPISDFFGPRFLPQSNHRYQMRPAAPPLLVTDRVQGIEGEPGSLSTGKVWAETDVTASTWGLDATGCTSVLVACESGQSNLLLLSWLGFDLTHDGTYRYRMLEFSNMFYGPLPRVGETMAVNVTLERHVISSGLRLFFFTGELHVAGTLRSSARFTAGLFPPEALSAVPPSSASTHELRKPDGPYDPPRAATQRQSFSESDLQAYIEGRLADCFGEGFPEHGAQLPRTATKDLFALSHVACLELQGGPWGRGLLRALQRVTPEDWFFESHLPGDPCMPGFFLLEGGMQLLAFWLTATGCTPGKEGWRFSPVYHHQYTSKYLGQVTPQHAEIGYEVVVESFVSDPEPMVMADVVCTLGALVIFKAKRLALKLVPA
jgi:3-hydroxymyristoyl/3-hydroxydecanoyl-(acyl carrier protein) dehydratase